MSKPIFKKRSPRCVSIDNELLEILQEYAKETRIPTTRIIDMALEEYFIKIGKIKRDEK